ncbi:MAG: hypothetical protein JO257_15215 [Deltaproteobacteria bacterium]|nr:hypothetical protein [Deltaproteobacteria bacterium]
MQLLEPRAEARVNRHDAVGLPADAHLRLGNGDHVAREIYVRPVELLQLAFATRGKAREQQVQRALDQAHALVLARRRLRVRARHDQVLGEQHELVRCQERLARRVAARELRNDVGDIAAKRAAPLRALQRTAQHDQLFVHAVAMRLVAIWTVTAALRDVAFDHLRGQLADERRPHRSGQVPRLLAIAADRRRRGRRVHDVDEVLQGGVEGL